MKSLTLHPSCKSGPIREVKADIEATGSGCRARFRLTGDIGAIKVPGHAPMVREDNLWKTTCFEIFLKEPGAQSYTEWNLSPSEGWNAYNFDDYREGMRERHVPRTPDCTMRPGNAFAVFDAAIPASTISDDEQQMGITCVLEEEGGVKSFWAMKHAKDQPDFHDPACFAARLAAPTAP